MEPARAVAELHHAVARGLTGDLQRDHGQRNLLGQLNQCGDLLAASAESAEAVRRTSFALREAAAAEEAREGGGAEGKAAQLRAKLSHALEVEEESKKTLAELENVSPPRPPAPLFSHSSRLDLSPRLRAQEGCGADSFACLPAHRNTLPSDWSCRTRSTVRSRG